MGVFGRRRPQSDAPGGTDSGNLPRVAPAEQHTLVPGTSPLATVLGATATPSLSSLLAAVRPLPELSPSSPAMHDAASSPHGSSPAQTGNAWAQSSPAATAHGANGREEQARSAAAGFDRAAGARPDGERRGGGPEKAPPPISHAMPVAAHNEDFSASPDSPGPAAPADLHEAAANARLSVHIGELEFAVVREPSSSRLRRELGNLYLQAGRIAEAKEQMRKAEDLKPRRMPAPR